MLFRVLTVLALVISCAGCSREDNIRVAQVPQDWFNAPMILAISGWEGQPPAEGVNTFSQTSGLASKTAVMSGHAEVGLASPVVLLRDPESARRIKLLGCYMRSAAVLGIATRGADVEQPIGYVANTISEVFLANYLISRGQGDAYFSGGIRKVPLLPPNVVEALKGSTDAAASVRSAAIWEPHLSRARGDAGAKIIPNPGVYTVHVCLIARRDASKPQQRAIEAFAGRVAQASAYIQRNPDAARAAVETRAGFPAGALGGPWRAVDFRYVADRASLNRILAGEVEALRRARMMNGDPDVSAYY